MEKILAALGGGAKVVELLVKLIIAAIVIYMLYQLWIKWKRRNAGKAFVDKSQLDPAKNYQNIAKQVNDAVSGWLPSGDDIEAVCKQLLFLTDNELREVNNQYLQLYGKGTKTLQDAISGPICLFCEARDLLLERLQKLNLN
jgi:hypothetical protein